jgi:iron complex outermembrane receptor protein
MHKEQRSPVACGPVSFRGRRKVHAVLPVAAALVGLSGVPAVHAAEDDGESTSEDAAPAITLGETSENDGGQPGETALDPVVISATRTETPVSELTRSVTLIDREDLKAQSRIERNPGDILGKEVPGLGTGTNALSNFTQTLRGRDFLTVVDGIPQSTPLRNASRDLNTFSVEAVERIEVVRGGTAAYGFGATGGLVNVITRRPEDGAVNGYSEAGLGISTEHPGDSLTWNTSHGLSGRSGQVDYVFNGNFTQRNGFFDADGDRIAPDPLGNQGGLAESEEYDLLGKVGYSFDRERQRIEVAINRFKLEQTPDFTFAIGDPAQGQKTTAVPGDQNVENPGTEVTSIATTYSNEDLLGGSLEVKGYYNDSTATFSKFPGFPQSEVRSEKWGLRSTAETPVDLGVAGITAIYGLDVLNDRTVQASLDGRTVVPVMDQTAVAGFGEVEIPVGAWGQIRGGVRHERIDVDVSDVVNRGGIAVDGGTLEFNETLFNLSAVAFVTDRVEVFGGFSQGFSVGDIGRAIRDGSATDAEQLESEAQKVNNWELGTRGRVGPLDASLTGFFSSSENGTTFQQDLSIVTQPERIWGVEATADVQATERLALGGTFTWQDGEVDLDDDGDFDEDLPTTRIAPIKITGHADYAPTEWLSTRLQGLYSGNRTPDSTQFGNGEVDDFVVFDALASVNTGYGTVDVGVENLLNNDYFPVVSQSARLPWGYSKAPGRRVTLTYSVQW